ncbi:MAG: hypothetical protein AABW51_00410 [Nanoarchaeota archaeon]
MINLLDLLSRREGDERRIERAKSEDGSYNIVENYLQEGRLLGIIPVVVEIERTYFPAGRVFAAINLGHKEKVKIKTNFSKEYRKQLNKLKSVTNY